MLHTRQKPNPGCWLVTTASTNDQPYQGLVSWTFPGFSHIWHKISRQIPTTTTTANVFYVIIVEVQLPWAFLGHSHLRCSEHVNIFAFFGWSSFIWASGKYKTTGKPPLYLLLPQVAAHFFHGDLHAGRKRFQIQKIPHRRFQTVFPQPSARFAQLLMFTEPKMYRFEGCFIDSWWKRDLKRNLLSPGWRSLNFWKGHLTIQRRSPAELQAGWRYDYTIWKFDYCIYIYIYKSLVWIKAFSLC